MRPNATQGSELLDYGQVAEILGVTRATVRRYASRDTHFPAPVADSVNRQPRFDREVIDAYVQHRGTPTPGKSGRPPRKAPVRRAAAAGGDFGARVRSTIASGKHPITTQRQLAALFDISTINLSRRLNGTASWKREELQVIHDQLGIVPSRGILIRDTLAPQVTD